MTPQEVLRELEGVRQELAQSRRMGGTVAQRGSEYAQRRVERLIAALGGALVPEDVYRGPYRGQAGGR